MLWAERRERFPLEREAALKRSPDLEAPFPWDGGSGSYRRAANPSKILFRHV
jgi:hypothetical protein